jgi:flagellar motor component MotA
MSIIDYWREFIVLIGLISAYFGGRKSKEFKEKTEGAGAIDALQKIYEKYIEHNTKITEQINQRVNQLEQHNRELQKNFNDMSISYSVVMGESKKFEAQYNLLCKEYEQLKVDHEKLRKAFDDYKKKDK